MDKKFVRALYIRRSAEFLGVLPLLGQLAQNNWRINHVSIAMLLVPWVTGIAVNLLNYLYLDYKFDRMRLYHKYGIE